MPPHESDGAVAPTAEATVEPAGAPASSSGAPVDHEADLRIVAASLVDYCHDSDKWKLMDHSNGVKAYKMKVSGGGAAAEAEGAQPQSRGGRRRVPRDSSLYSSVACASAIIDSAGCRRL
jgi:hypothetical protein